MLSVGGKPGQSSRQGLDQALAESVESFPSNLAKSRDMFLGILGRDLRGPLSAISVPTGFSPSPAWTRRPDKRQLLACPGPSGR